MKVTQRGRFETTVGDHRAQTALDLMDDHKVTIEIVTTSFQHEIEVVVHGERDAIKAYVAALHDCEPADVEPWLADHYREVTP